MVAATVGRCRSSAAVPVVTITATAVADATVTGALSGAFSTYGTSPFIEGAKRDVRKVLVGTCIAPKTPKPVTYRPLASFTDGRTPPTRPYWCPLAISKGVVRGCVGTATTSEGIISTLI